MISVAFDLVPKIKKHFSSISIKDECKEDWSDKYAVFMYDDIYNRINKKSVLELIEERYRKYFTINDYPLAQEIEIIRRDRTMSEINYDEIEFRLVSESLKERKRTSDLFDKVEQLDKDIDKFSDKIDDLVARVSKLENKKSWFEFLFRK